MYRLLLRVMFLLPPETIHRIVFGVIRAATALAPARALLHRLFAVNDPVLRTTAFGIEFATPLGLAAGFDKDATGVDAWGALGFGFAEIGTVTAAAQPGNPQPRLFRLPADRALINRMGFNNHGAAAAAARLHSRKTTAPLGANIGKTKVVDAAHAADDYAVSARLLGPLADFVVVNVSSPNTPGLRDLQAVESLRPVLTAVLDSVRVPVLVKIAPDLSDEDVDAAADLAVELGVAGIVATNTTIGRDGLASDP
ncbi:MAG: dihydroorotate dehydrogenase (quinone), partial [Nocardia sp.]|nr:dihydroorotate dehydrogenase (quinone) [Nocardia sp.]